MNDDNAQTSGSPSQGTTHSQSTASLNPVGVAQGQNITYELHSLGWKAFQDLCAMILSEILGQTGQSFSESHDGGRDGAFRGTWKQRDGESLSGSFTLQCKFSCRRDNHLSLADLQDELAKAKRLAARGLADNYLVLTNTSVTGTEDEKIRVAFEAIPGIRTCCIYGVEWINKVIKESPRLRMLVPRIYGIGDLSQIMDERAYAQASAILSALGDDLNKFVITKAYRESLKAIRDHGFVLLLGEPASGKSTIAATLALASIDYWKCAAVKARDADDFIKHWNPNDPRQFFWIDDAFGVTQAERESIGAWNRAFGYLTAALRKGTRILFTSRDYIYAAALGQLKHSAFPALKQSQVIIHVQESSSVEKEQILYNHLRLGKQPKEFRTRVKGYLPKVASTPSLLPELARRLGDPFFTGRMEVSERGLLEFVQKPNEFLMEVLRPLDGNYRAALALIFMRGGLLGSPLSLSPEERNAVGLFGSDTAGVLEALRAMRESLVLQVNDGENAYWKFKHPTVRDAFGQIISQERDLMDVYLAGAPLNKLCDEMTCGDVGIKGVKVIVPADRFGRILLRLNTLDVQKARDREILLSFLAYRCSKAFLSLYIAEHPGLVPLLQVQSFMEENFDVNLLAALHKNGLLSEHDRSHFADTIMKLALEKPDSYVFEDADVGALLSREQMTLLLDRVRLELIPRLDTVIQRWEKDYEDADEGKEDFRLYDVQCGLIGTEDGRSKVSLEATR